MKGYRELVSGDYVRVDDIMHNGVMYRPLKTTERRKTVRAQRSGKQPQDDICPHCHGNWSSSMHLFPVCPLCKGTGKRSPVRFTKKLKHCRG